MSVGPGGRAARTTWPRLAALGPRPLARRPPARLPAPAAAPPRRRGAAVPARDPARGRPVLPRPGRGPGPARGRRSCCAESMRSLSAGHWWLAVLPGAVPAASWSSWSTRSARNLRAAARPEEPPPVSISLRAPTSAATPATPDDGPPGRGAAARGRGPGGRLPAVRPRAAPARRHRRGRHDPCDVRAGEVVALVGASGAGKSLLGARRARPAPAERARAAGEIRLRRRAARPRPRRRALAGGRPLCCRSRLSHLDPSATVGAPGAAQRPAGRARADPRPGPGARRRCASAASGREVLRPLPPRALRRHGAPGAHRDGPDGRPGAARRRRAHPRAGPRRRRGADRCAEIRAMADAAAPSC